MRDDAQLDIELEEYELSPDVLFPHAATAVPSKSYLRAFWRTKYWQQDRPYVLEKALMQLMAGDPDNEQLSGPFR